LAARKGSVFLKKGLKEGGWGHGGWSELERSFIEVTADRGSLTDGGNPAEKTFASIAAE